MEETSISTEEKKEEVESSGKKPSQGTSSNLDVDAFHNFVQGKRHILVQDYVHAVGSLGKACELYVEHYGQTAIECAEVYFHYGKALFRLFQQQAGILGDVLPDGSEEEEEEEEEGSNETDSEEDKEKESAETTSNENGEGEEEEEEEDIGEDSEDSKKAESDVEMKPSESNAQEAAPEGSSKSDDSSKPPQSESLTNENEITKVDKEKSSEGVTEAQETTSASSSKEVKPVPEIDNSEAGPSGCQPKPNTEDEISDLQLAWETLETAKSIFQKQGKSSSDSQLKVAEILLILAEISMELENYASAVQDLTECLRIREGLLKPDDRLIAETYYQIALAHTYDSQVAPAIENYKKSIEVIQLRIESLKKQTVIEQTPDGFDIDPSIEISELEEILQDIRAKMEDTQDMIQDAKKIVKDMAFQKLEEASSSTDRPVTNIGHLLKRKKPEDVESAKPIEVKRIKLQSAENGDSQEKSESASLPKV